MHDPADNPRTGPFYLHHPPVVRRWRRPRLVLAVALVFTVGAALMLATLWREPQAVRSARRQIDESDQDTLRRSADALDRQLSEMFRMDLLSSPVETAADASAAIGGGDDAHDENHSLEHASSSHAPVAVHPATVAPVRRSARSAATVDGALRLDNLRRAQAADAAITAARVNRELESMTPADGVRTIRLTLAQANAWLRVNLADWARAHDYAPPPEVTRPVVSIDGDQLVMGFRYSGRYFTQNFSVTFKTRFGADGKARIDVLTVRAGSLPLPMGALVGTLDGMSAGGREARAAGRWIERMQDLEFSPTVRLSNGQRLRVVGYRPDGDGIELSLRAEPAKPAPRTAAR